MDMDLPAFNRYAAAGLALILLVLYKHTTRVNLDFIPAVGPSGPLSSYITAFKSLVNGCTILQEGYDKYHPSMFRIPTLDKWIVVLSGPKLIDDLRRAREEDLSFYDAVGDGLQIKYTLGPEIETNHYHVEVVRSALTRNLGVRFSDIRDEIVQAFSEVLPLKGDEWSTVPAVATVMQVVCRTSNRLFVGLPLCRDPDYLALNIEFTVAVATGAYAINLFPKALHPIIGPLVSPVRRAMKRASKHLAPVIEERLRNEAQYGKEWAERPNDLLSWLIDEAPEDRKTVYDLALRIIVVNFAAIHTSSLGFTHALYSLAANPEYAQPMREEVEAVVREEGWTKAAMGKMRKLDSFLRESQRLNGLGANSMDRLITKPSGFTFSDGTTLPKGTRLTVAMYATHHNESIYGPDPDVFDGFRFANMRDAGEGEGIKYQMVNTNVDYVSFGHGRHACPGRFFAANELKAMLAHVVTTYDVKFEDEGVRPPNEWFGNGSDRRLMMQCKQLDVLALDLGREQIAEAINSLDLKQV